MVNNAATPHHVSTANPIAQVIILPYMAAMFQEVPRLSETIRGTMTFERPHPHVASSAPSGPLSPLMSPNNLFGDLLTKVEQHFIVYKVLGLVMLREHKFEVCPCKAYWTLASRS